MARSVVAPLSQNVIHVSFPDGSSHSLPEGITARDAISQVMGDPNPDVFAVKLNGVPRDLDASLPDGVSIEPLTFGSAEGKEIYRHSSTHIMAQAVKDCFPTAQLTIGPAIEEGFFYDFAFERPFTPEDLERIEQRAHEIIQPI